MTITEYFEELKTKEIIYYLPVLALSGIVAGVLIGLVAAALVKRIKLEV